MVPDEKPQVPWSEYKKKYPLTFSDQSKSMESRLAERRAEAWELARKAAQILKSSFAANRVVLFGSLARPGSFTRWSDVDLAAWGIPPTRYFAAVAAVTGLSSRFKVDLVDPENCRPSIRQAIEKEGVDL